MSGKPSTRPKNRPPKKSLSIVPDVIRNNSLWRAIFGSSSRAQTEQDSQDVSISPIGPGKVDFGQKDGVQFAMEPGPDGDTLEIKRVTQEKETAVTKIQAAFRRYKARELYQSLQELQKMNLEIKWPEGTPFLGLLIVKVNSIKNIGNLRNALVRIKFDDDQSISVNGVRDESQILQYDYRATFVNIVLRSDSILTIEVMQAIDMPGRLIAKVQLPVSTLSQGKENRELYLRSSNGDTVGVMHVTIGYTWLRGTTDIGGYRGPELVVMPSRKLRGNQPHQAFERLWQVNHWVCSHDNVWTTSPDFADIVREAVRRKRVKDASFEVTNDKGETQIFNPNAPTEFLKAATQDTERQNFTTEEFLFHVLGTTKIPVLDSVDSVLSTASSATTWTFGKEDWKRTLDELEGVNSTDTKTSSSLEEEETVDFARRTDFLDDDSSSESTTSESTENPSINPTKSDNQVFHERRSSTLPEKMQNMLKCSLAPQKKKRVKPTSAVISGKFEYGVYRPASRRGVHVFLRVCDNTSDGRDVTIRPIYVGEHQTTKHGRLEVPVPKSVSPIAGLYHVMALLPDDNTFGHGSLYLLEKGTKCVVFDLDGTITTSDVHVVARTLLDSVSASTVIGSSIGKSYDIVARPNALACVRAWAAKGYQVLYVSGRQGSAYNMTLEWLIKHGYPPGPIHLTRTHLPTLPVYVSVGHFKIKYLKELQAKGLEIYAAYGNTGTDIKAYEAVGIPKERTFILGSTGGKKGTTAVKNFTTHLVDVLRHPDSEKPIPYTELLDTIPWQKT